MTRYNANTVSSLDQLLRQLKTVRYRGFALENEETRLGFRSVAAPIFDSHGSVMAALGVVGTIEQISSENLPQLVEAVMSTAAAITAAHSDPLQSKWDEPSVSSQQAS
jgi:IclR family acetate operon transcriptional repressor